MRSLTFSLLLCYTNAMSETASYNRTYKDSVFVDLFSTDEKAKERFLSLYNALHGTKLPLHCPIEQLKLDNTMYRGLINDVSCLVDNKIIVLAEHQSTINENMPSQRLYLLVQSLLTSFCLKQKLAAVWNHRHLWRC